jgi:hypothetical protein
MDNFKPNHKTPPAATNPTPGHRPGTPQQAPKGNVPGGQQGWQKPAPKKAG